MTMFQAFGLGFTSSLLLIVMLLAFMQRRGWSNIVFSIKIKSNK